MRVAGATLLIVSTFVALAALAPGDAQAQERLLRRPPPRVLVPYQPPPAPMLAVVGLREQRITVYDTTGGRMLEAPVSSGAEGYETPPGIFSVVQKEEEHHSNLYDDASMPFMQRLTWTGIALHAGALPGYPASHGCVRMPEDFAERLYGLTNTGLRVVVAREGIAPVPIAEPAMFRRSREAAPDEAASRATPASPVALRQTPLQANASRMMALTRAAEDAAARARDARTAEAGAKAAVPPAERALHQAEATLAKAEADLAAAEKLIADNAPPKKLADAEKVKAAAPARIEAARAQLEKARDDAKSKREAAYDSEAAATAAATLQATTADAAEQAKLATAPVSVFVSRKTQRVYVRKDFHPLWEGPVLIRDADKPIGTFVFTATGPSNAPRAPGWTVISLFKNPTAIEPPAPRAKGRHAAPAEQPLTDAVAAQAALDRLDVPAEIAAHISETVLPGSSLIISDEPPHLETGKDTDFVVVMSGEPQGGITIRQKPPARTAATGGGYARDRDDDDDDRPYRRQQRRPRGGGFGFGGGGGWFD